MNIKTELKNTGGDVAHAVVSGVLSCAPFIGGAASEIFNLILASPLEKRRDKCLIFVYDALQQLEKTVAGFNMEELKNNEVFISSMMQGIQIALKNHEEEKLSYLRNAVINSITQDQIDDTEKMMFLHMIDNYSALHINILHYFHNPSLKFQECDIPIPDISVGASSDDLFNLYPELESKKEIVNLIIKELYNSGFLITDSIYEVMSETGVYVGGTTEFGCKFVNYIL